VLAADNPQSPTFESIRDPWQGAPPQAIFFKRNFFAHHNDWRKTNALTPPTHFFNITVNSWQLAARIGHQDNVRPFPAFAQPDQNSFAIGSAAVA
jgi:hypothetical protein